MEDIFCLVKGAKTHTGEADLNQLRLLNEIHVQVVLIITSYYNELEKRLLFHTGHGMLDDSV